MTAAADLLRIVVFGPHGRVGAWAGDTIVDLAAASDGRLPADLLGLIAAGERGVDDARRVTEDALAGRGSVPDEARMAVDGVRLHAPTVDRPRIACAAGNYAAHTLGSAARKGAGASRALEGIVQQHATGLPSVGEVTDRTRERGVPRGFWKDFGLPHGPEDGIPYPTRAEQFDYEGEVAVVLGRQEHDVPSGRGRDLIWGVTLLNDWSIRGSGQKDSLSFNLSKNFDGGASVGPSIVVGGLDPSDLVVETRVNGEVRQHYHSGDMIFDHGAYIEYLSRDFSWLPGDLVSGGSGPGTATDATKGDDPDDSLFLAVGDIVEVEVAQIGVLRNRIVQRG